MRTANGTGDTLDLNNTQRALVKHVSGDYYITESCSTWSDADICTGWHVLTAVGPLNLRDDLGIEGPLEPSRELFDAIDNAVNLTDEDADWLNEEDHEGRLTYPIGAR